MLFSVPKSIIIACLFTTAAVHSTDLFRQYKKIAGVRFSHVQRLLRSLAAEKLRCAVTCLRTADCDSFQHNNNTSVSLNCELLMTSAMDYDTLTPAADWSVYSSHPLLTESPLVTTSGETCAWLFCRSCCLHEHKFTTYMYVEPSVYSVCGSWRQNVIDVFFFLVYFLSFNRKKVRVSTCT